MLAFRDGLIGGAALKLVAGASRALLVATVFALGSGGARAATLDVNFDITGGGTQVTSAVLHLVSSTVSNFSTFSGTLISCTSQCGPPVTGSGQLNNGAVDSTIVTTGSDGGTYDLVFGNFNSAANPTKVIMSNGLVTSITWTDYIFATSNDHSCGICILSLTATTIGAHNDSSGVHQEGILTLDQSTVSATPLPAALPLFATGLGAMGLLARRRKRKNATALAAA